MADERAPEIKTVKRLTVRFNRTTGKFAGLLVRRVITNPQDLSIDELPPVGVDGPLSKIPAVRPANKATRFYTRGNYTADLDDPDKDESEAEPKDPEPK